jgi:hypothetical protein
VVVVVAVPPVVVVVVPPPARVVVVVAAGLVVVVVAPPTVVVVDAGVVVVVVAAGDGTKMSFTVCCPAMSSIAVTSSNAITKTRAAVKAMVGQLNCRRRKGFGGRVTASMRSVAGASATAETSKR